MRLTVTFIPWNPPEEETRVCLEMSKAPACLAPDSWENPQRQFYECFELIEKLMSTRHPRSLPNFCSSPRKWLFVGSSVIVSTLS